MLAARAGAKRPPPRDGRPRTLRLHPALRDVPPRGRGSLREERGPEGNDPLAPTAGPRLSSLAIVVRRLLRHADEDFLLPAFDGMVESARRDSKQYWESARREWSREWGTDVSEVRLPDNTGELEDAFWGQVGAAVREAFRERGQAPTKKAQRRAG